MIVKCFFDVLFTVVNYIFGWLPAAQELVLADKITNIFGYGVYVCGDNFFTAISVIGMAELVGLVTWSIVVFIWRIVHG